MSRTRRGRGGRGQQIGDTQEMTWFRMDLHLHTPASADYQDLSATYLAILQKAEERDLDIVAFTDHNSVSGIAAMRREIEDLELLEELDRLAPAEKNILDEYRRLRDKILVLPGFEFTAAYGFHILGIFSPETTVRHLEHLLMALDVPEEQMETGSGQVGATADVLTAYEIIHDGGGLVIPAHVDAAHGVAMQGFRFGGPTKVAYTQSEYLHALEVTDLDDLTRRATASFFNGSKPEYPRRMHCIQGSDAHRLSREGANRDTDLGIGDRATEVQLPERSFVALKALFLSEEFSRIRPYQPLSAASFDTIQAAREQGPSSVQSFHEQVRSQRSRYRPITKDVVAFANTNGGTIYVGVTANPTQPVAGVPNAEEAARSLSGAIARSVVPKLDVRIEVTSSAGKPVLLVTVPKGDNTPYATDAGQVFVRQESETVVALRDEIVQLVRNVGSVEAVSPAEPERIRAWTAPRQAVDEDGDITDSDTDNADAREEPETEAVSATDVIQEQPEERRTPRRRRSRRRPAQNQSAAETDAQPSEAEGEPIAATLNPSGLPEAVTQFAQPAADVALMTSDSTAEPASDHQVVEVSGVDVSEADVPETSAPKPRPRRRTRKATTPPESAVESAIPPQVAMPESPAAPVDASTPLPSRNGTEPAETPKTGVEILSIAERDGERYYTMRDLRSRRVADNVTRKSARRLWRQAILEREKGLPDPDAIRWDGPLGYWGSSNRDGVRRHNLAYRENGDIRYFYAVSDDGINEVWRALIPIENA
ncbi:MAG: putative DNA binding domain-containing protein [Chloroflexota bacterium]|nr:putative DNA binding domain-containing protein [Chloroflexota bacterium]